MRPTVMKDAQCWRARRKNSARESVEKRELRVDVRKMLLSQFIEMAFIQTRARDWLSPSSRSVFGVSQKILHIMKLLVDASVELGRCEISNGQVVPSNVFSTTLASCLFEMLALVGGMRIDRDVWAAKVLNLLDRKRSGEHVIRR